MRRWLIFLLTLLLIVAGFALSGIWMFNTTEGARWIIGVISHFAPVGINAEKVTGQLGRELWMEGVHVHWPWGEIEVQEFKIRWQPLNLLTGKVTIEELSLHGVQIQDNRPEIKTVPDFEWPKASGLLLWIHGGVENLHVKDFSYRRQSRDSSRIKSFASRLNWSYGLLTLEKLDLQFPSGAVKGRVELGLAKPSLYIDINFSPSKTISGIDSLKLNSRLLSFRSTEKLAGNVVIEGKSGLIKRFLMEGEIGITKNAIYLKNVVLSRSGRQGHFTGNGQIAFTAGKVKMSLGMKFSDLDLSRELGIRTAFSGGFNIEGSPKDYRGYFKIENTKGKWYSGHLSGRLKGDLQKAHITFLEGSMLDGNFQGDLNVKWEEGLSLKGSLQARNLNPAIITPDWEGKINLDLEGTFHLPKKTSPEGKLRIHLHKSHLRGQPFTGNIELYWEKSILSIAKADLKGKGFDLFANGVLQERITFDADIKDLSGLIPGTRGSLLTRGWVRWRDQRLALNLNSHGEELFIKDVKLGSVDLSTRFDEEEGAPIEIKGKFFKVVYKSFRVDSLVLETTGKLSHHKMVISAHWPEGQIKSYFEGHYSEGKLHGKITYLSGSDPDGVWKLQVPAEIGISSSHIKVKYLQIGSTKGESLQFDIDLNLRPLRGILHVEWHQLNLARANPWLGSEHLLGRTKGYFSIKWIDEERLRMAGIVNLEGKLKVRPLEIGLSKGFVKFDWNEKGLQASWVFEDSKRGKLWGSLSSPQPGRMIIPERGILEVRWEGIDLGHLKPFLPRSMTLEGRLWGKLSGQWSERMKQFAGAGDLKVSQGKIGREYEKERIITNLQVGEVSCYWRDDQLRGSLSFDLGEVGRLKGNFILPLRNHLPTSVRDKGPIRLSLEGQFEERGLLPTFFPNLVQESHGKVDFGLLADGTWEKPNLKGSLRLAKTKVSLLAGNLKGHDKKGNLSADKILKVSLDRGQVQFGWDGKMLQGMGEFELMPAGKLRISLSSPQPPQFALPKQFKLNASWEAFDLNFLRSWLPNEMVLKGQLFGSLSGQYSNHRFDTIGEIRISQGEVGWKYETGSLNAILRRAKMTWSWKDDDLRGEIAINLVDYGQVVGNFQLHLPPHYPVAINPKGPIRFSINGQFKEKGLLPAFLPGIVQESQGQIHLNIKGNGTWEKPNLRGSMKLEKGGGYIPATGIRLKEMSIEAQFRGDHIRITSFKAHSGHGHLEGDGTIWLEDWKVSRYEGKLRGDRFQTLHLPEMQVLSNPHLDFHGTPQRLVVRGEIILPDLLISDPPTKDVIRTSPDVIIVDAPEVIKPKFPLALDIKVRLLLGEKVYYRAEGIDVRLRGGLSLNIQDPSRSSAIGEINVAQGHYSAYGHRLELIRGRIIFTGGPMENPSLDILAVRKINELQAGVAVTGTLQKPVIRLYSRPSMSDTDILSYIVLGQPLGKGTEAAPSLIQAAGALLSAGESVIMQGKLRNIFGLDTLDITTPPGGGEVFRSMVTIGKYLTPKLYISLGRSLFTDATLITLRYTLSKRLEIETTTGTESGVTLFYRIEFR